MPQEEKCPICHDQGRIVRQLVVGIRGGEPVVAEGWLPCHCPAGDEAGAACTECQGVGSRYVENGEATGTTMHACEHCSGSGEEPAASLLETAARFFEDDGWEVAQQPDNPILWMGFQGTNDEWRCFVQAREREQQLIFYSLSPRRVELGQRAQMAEYITRANYGMVIGNFELDYSDGEVRFKTSIDVEDARLTRPLLHHLIYANLLMMDKYLPGINAVIEGQTALSGIELVEGQPN